MNGLKAESEERAAAMSTANDKRNSEDDPLSCIHLTNTKDSMAAGGHSSSSAIDTNIS